VLAPWIRVGAKGSGEWRTATWDEALDLVAIASISARRREAIPPYHSRWLNGWLTEVLLATRLFRRLGASTLDRTFCAAATTAATRGIRPDARVALEDYAHAKLIVVGVNPSATGIHPCRSSSAPERRREARRDRSAQHAAGSSR
jgi:anaerobic selenocysteine-containing dehydrogenase